MRRRNAWRDRASRQGSWWSVLRRRTFARAPRRTEKVLNLDRWPKRSSSATPSSSASRATPATACSSRAASSRARRRSSATTSRRFPTIPAEIRAPAGSLPGVSGFQLHFADHDILTPGDRPDVLVAMNPAALKTNLKDLVKGGTLIVNRDAFTDAEPREGRLRGEPARGRLARRVPGARRRR